jgi:hypothetical protein
MWHWVNQECLNFECSTVVISGRMTTLKPATHPQHYQIKNQCSQILGTLHWQLTVYERQRLKNINSILCHNFDCECGHVACRCKIHSNFSWLNSELTKHSQRPFAMCRKELQHMKNNRWWDVGLCVQCQNKASVFTMQVKISPPRSSTKCDTAHWIGKDAQCFQLLRYGAAEVCCQMSICKSRILLQSLQAVWKQ